MVGGWIVWGVGGLTTIWGGLMGAGRGWVTLIGAGWMGAGLGTLTTRGGGCTHGTGPGRASTGGGVIGGRGGGLTHIGRGVTGGTGGGWTVKAGGVIGLCCGGRTRIGGGWMMTSGDELMKKVPPGTAISWKPAALRRSGTQFFCSRTLIGPSPHGAGKIFYYNFYRDHIILVYRLSSNIKNIYSTYHACIESLGNRCTTPTIHQFLLLYSK